VWVRGGRGGGKEGGRREGQGTGGGEKAGGSWNGWGGGRKEPRVGGREEGHPKHGSTRQASRDDPPHHPQVGGARRPILSSRLTTTVRGVLSSRGRGGPVGATEYYFSRNAWRPSPLSRLGDAREKLSPERLSTVQGTDATSGKVRTWSS